MRVLLLAVGRDRNSPTSALAAAYLGRCPWRIEAFDIAPCRNGRRARRLDDEAGRLRQVIPDDAALIVLDEQGCDLSSRAFAGRIECFRDDGRSALAFVIGGADGIAASLIDNADLRLAFGRATWPHRLVRVMLAEQLYRASTILAGHPYHRD